MLGSRKSLRDMVRLAGFEPATCCSGGNRSIHLSYRRTLLKLSDLFKKVNLQLALWGNLWGP